MTQAERDGIKAINTTPRRLIRWLLGQSCYSRARAALLDGDPIALWGLMGTALATTGHIWFSVTTEARARRFTLVREAAREIEGLFQTKLALESLVLADDNRAVRFLQFMGFELYDPAPIALGGALAYKAILRRPW
jgi:hypothetical protein